MASRKPKTPVAGLQTEMFGGIDRRPPERPLRRIPHPLWTENKAKLIERYLYYFVFVTHHGTYIDGFAGPQNPRKLGMWAARLVLQSKPKWLRHFYLCDIDSEKVRLLKRLKSNRRCHAQGREIRVYRGDFNSQVRKLLRSDRIRPQEATFCLLDQRTFECSWRTVVSLSRHKRPPANKIELFYFLAIRWLHRALSGKKDSRALHRWWGRDDWRELQNLSQDEIMKRFVARLKDELGYESVKPWPIFEKRGSNVIMYYMVHASDHPEAQVLMERAYHKVVKPRESYRQLSLELKLPVPPSILS